MRPLHEIKTEICSITETNYETPRKKSAAMKRLQFLRLAEQYIESNPDEYFINKEISRLEQRNDLIIDAFDVTKYPGKDRKEAMKAYEKEMELPHLRNQIKALRFIKK